MPETDQPTEISARRWRSAVDSGVRSADGWMLNLARLSAGRSGDLLGSGVGQSVEFMDFREYEPGDDIRRIDWQVYARTDRVMIRRHREEISPVIEIILDGSRSMDLPGTPKADTALALTAAIAAASVRTGLATRFGGVSSASPRVHSLKEPRAIDWHGFDGTATLADASPALRSAGATRGMRIVISDMLFSCDFTRLYRDFVRGTNALILIQVLAQADADPSSSGSVLLRDRETGASIQADLTPHILRQYQARFNAHAAMLREAAASARAIFVPIVCPPSQPDPQGAVRALSASGVFRSLR